MVVTSRSNKTVAHMRKLGRSGSYRNECGAYLGDGFKLLQSCVQSSSQIQTILLTEGLTCPPVSDDTTVVFVSESVMEWVSPMKTPQGVVFSVKIPHEFSLCPPNPPQLTLNQYLILDGVQDPGNVGTIWRTIQGLGFSALLLLEGCASPWNPKTVRSSMGACFHIPVWCGTATQVVEFCKQSHLPLYGTCLEKESVPLSAVDFKQCAVVLGNEGQGVSPSLLEQCVKTLYIPMEQGCESLNVATMATIVLWEMKRGK